MKNPCSVNITIRANQHTSEKVKELATQLNTTSSQVFKWLIDSSLEIIESQDPVLPSTLALMRGFSHKTEKKIKLES